MAIRTMTLQDAAACAEIEAQGYPAEATEGAHMFEMLAHRAQSGDKALQLLVWDAGHAAGGVLAYAIGYAVTSRRDAPCPLLQHCESEDDAHKQHDLESATVLYWYVHDMCVSKAASGQGIAKKLLCHMLQNGLAPLCDHVLLTAVFDAPAFWAKLGFALLWDMDEHQLARLSAYPKGTVCMEAPRAAVLASCGVRLVVDCAAAEAESLRSPATVASPLSVGSADQEEEVPASGSSPRLQVQ